MDLRRFSLTSLGCRVNQAEADYLAGELEAMGWLRVERGQPADFSLLMTCAVTSSAARQSRQMARRLAKEPGAATVVVTGCGAQAEAEAYLDDGHVVVGRADLTKLPDMLNKGELPQGAPSLAPDQGIFCPGVLAPGEARSRAMLKVQDGCDAHCAYCIVPSTRGAPRSLPVRDAVTFWQNLAGRGANEIVLTGIHLGRWGWDFEPPDILENLVRALLNADPRPRLRLSSLESHEVTPGLIELAAGHPKVCRHFHLPLQSGSDKVLAAMGRPYDSGQYRRVAESIAAAIPNVCLGADVLVGLPGEDDAAFKETRRLIEELPICHLHVFPYSPRPGTKAAKMRGRPKGPEINERCADLRSLGAAKKNDFLQGLVGRTLEVVVEGQDGCLGRSSEYALVRLDQSLPKGSLAMVDITAFQPDDSEPLLVGRVTDQPQSNL